MIKNDIFVKRKGVVRMKLIIWPFIHYIIKKKKCVFFTRGVKKVIILQLTVACIKMDRPEIAERAVKIAEGRLAHDKWPEYYDTKRGRFIGKQSRLFQTWTIAGYLVSKLLLADPSKAKILMTDEDSELASAFCMITSNPRKKRGPKSSQKSYIVWASIWKNSSVATSAFYKPYLSIFLFFTIQKLLKDL